MLVWRVLYELLVLGTQSQRLVVTTFTRRASTELQVRLVERSDALIQAAHVQGLHLADPRVHDLRIGTIHSLCDALLAEFDPNYSQHGTQVIDDTEVLQWVRIESRGLFSLSNDTNSPQLLPRPQAELGKLR
jgi:superfamily I DNA/RNA helicase